MRDTFSMLKTLTSLRTKTGSSFLILSRRRRKRLRVLGRRVGAMLDLFMAMKNGKCRLPIKAA